MKRRLATTVAAISGALFIGALAAPVASAAPESDPVLTRGGSLNICWTIPMPGSAALSFCI